MNNYTYKIPKDKVKELILTVRRYPTLYDCSDPKYCNNYEKGRIWKKITTDLDLPKEQFVRETWHKLKYFYKSIQTQIKKGQVPKKWRYTKLMSYFEGNKTLRPEGDEEFQKESKRADLDSESDSSEGDSEEDNDSLNDFFMSAYYSASLMPRLLQLQVKREIFAALTETEEMLIGS